MCRDELTCLVWSGMMRRGSAVVVGWTGFFCYYAIVEERINVGVRDMHRQS